MKVSELKTVVETKLGGITLDNNWFLSSLNDVYSEIQDDIKKLDPYSVIGAFTFELNTISGDEEVSTTLPEDCLTIERVEYFNEELSSRLISIPTTTFDEKADLHHLRWFRMGNLLFFRGLEGYLNGGAYYWKKNTILNFDPDNNIDDEFNLPDPSHNSYLKFYIIGDYYDDENLETDGSKFMLKFKEKKEIILRSIKPVNEPSRLRLKIENGID